MYTALCVLIIILVSAGLLLSGAGRGFLSISSFQRDPVPGGSRLHRTVIRLALLLSALLMLIVLRAVSLAPSSAGPGDVPAPVFSRESGFYEEAFDLSIEAREGLTIYYTLDCGTPSAGCTEYKVPVHVYDRSSEPDRFRAVPNVTRDHESVDDIDPGPADKAFIVRAVAVDPEGNTSVPVTKTYFIGLPQYQHKTVVSLVTDPASLFDPQTGIYVTGAAYDAWTEGRKKDPSDSDPSGSDPSGDGSSGSDVSGSNASDSDASGDGVSGSGGEKPVPNFTRRGDEWEREADFSLWRDSRPVVSQPAGIRIQGNYAREYAKKRFSIFAREKYSGSRWFDAPVAGDKKTHSLMTRDSFLNAFSLNLAQGRAAAAQTAEPVIVFLNGELWEDDYYLMEKYSAAWFAEEYGLHQDTIRMIKTTFWSSVPEEDRQIYEEILDFARTHDLSEDAAYAALGKMIDLSSYIDYWCMNLYLDNEDAGETINVCLWRVDRVQNDDEGDGRWRWAMQDLDLTWGRRDRGHHGEQPWEVNTFALADSRSPGEDCRALRDQPLFSALRNNPCFRRQFALTFMDLVNTTFRKETVLEKLEQTESARDIYKSFFANRADYIVPAMAEEFGLTGTLETITIRTEDPGAGTVTLGTITPDLSGGEWSGQYFTDFPVTLTAEPAPGFVFSGWLVDGKPAEGPALELSFGKGGAEIRPVFEKKP